MKKLSGLLILLVLVCTMLAACNITGNPGTAGNTVGLAAANFAQSSITIKKGESITLVNQTGTAHIISNGSWNGNTQDPVAEPGAPIINNATLSSDNQSLAIGPFNTAGTFHYYCSVHPGMNLAVVVQ